MFGRISAEISAEFSVNLAEISVSAETDFCRFGRSLLISQNSVVTWSQTRLEIVHQNLNFQTLLTKLFSTFLEKSSFYTVKKQW